MRKRHDDARRDRQYLRALTIREGRGVGLWLPIIRHLALGGHTGAMTDLADWLSVSNTRQSLGLAGGGFSAAALYRRAFRKGEARAALNMAISCFNRDDMAGYRQWLRRAACAGDRDAAAQIRRFETRLWHGAAREIGRLRPWHKRDDFA